VCEGFTLEYVDVGDVTLRVRHGGDGRPVVLLHGHPRTHTTSHRIAPQLAGSSSSPAPTCALTI
jgi:haloacetate dehalogenase